MPRPTSNTLRTAASHTLAGLALTAAPAAASAQLAGNGVSQGSQTAAPVAAAAGRRAGGRRAVEA
jgi:hypothetical protein